MGGHPEEGQIVRRILQALEHVRSDLPRARQIAGELWEMRELVDTFRGLVTGGHVADPAPAPVGDIPEAHHVDDHGSEWSEVSSGVFVRESA